MEEKDQSMASEEGCLAVWKDMSRSERRHERARLKRSRKAHWGFKDLSQESPKRQGQVVDTPTLCSCPMCGNPRKWTGEPTMQERRFWQSQRLE